MKNVTSYSRRDFVKAASGLAMATEFLPLPQLMAGAAPALCWTVACRDVHLKSTGQPDCWAALKDLGIPGVEVAINETLDCPSLFHPGKKYRLSDDAGIQALRADLEAQGAVITALCMANRLEDRLEAEAAWMKAAVGAALKLKVNAIRIDIAPHSLPNEQFLPVAIQTCKRYGTIVEGTPVRLGIENHGAFTNDPSYLEKIFSEVGSSHLGLTFDPANLYWFGHPLEDVYAIGKKFAPRAIHTHCKNIQYPEDRRQVRRPRGWEYSKYAAPLYTGDIDYKKIAALLREAGFTGDLCLENECLGHFPAAQQPEVLRKEAAALKMLV
jgi:sugar phosphate isomerase/epimerase